jgi:hypothetical protein
MNVESEVRRALEELAEGAPPLATDRLLSRARGRRRVRRLAIVAVPVCVVLVLGGAILAAMAAFPPNDAAPGPAGDGGRRDAAVTPGSTGDGDRGETPVPAGECGGPAPVAPAMDPSAATGPLMLSLDVPAEVTGGRLTGTATVTNGGSHRISGFTGVVPDYFVVGDARVVTTPAARRENAIALDLAPGNTKAFPVDIALVRCDASATEAADKTPMSAGPPGSPLPPGDYQVIARLSVFTGTGNAETLLQTGPIAFRLR